MLLVMGMLHPESHYSVQLLPHTLLPGSQSLPLLFHVLKGDSGLGGTATQGESPWVPVSSEDLSGPQSCLTHPPIGREVSEHSPQGFPTTTSALASDPTSAGAL